MRAALAAALALAAISARAAIKNPDTFVYATIGDAESLDPAWAYDSSSHEIIANVYEYLLAFKGSGVRTSDLVGRLSEKVPTRANGLISADGRTYRFPIRKGVRFQDGTPLTPDDVRYSLMRFLLFDRDGGPSSLLLEPILGLTTTRPNGKLREDAYALAAKAIVVEGDDVVVRLPRPFAPFPTILTNFGAIVSRKWCAAHGQWDGQESTWKKFADPTLDAALPKTVANGTGPFRLARYEPRTKETRLERNDAYWGKPAKLKAVVIKVVEEFSTRKLILEAGDADSIYVPQMYFPQVNRLPGVTATDGLTLLERGAMLFFNFKMNAAGNPNIGSGRWDGDGVPADFFSDKDVRKAFAHAIDGDAYVRDIARGQGRATNSLLPPGLLGRQDRPPRYRLDRAKMEEHFRKAWGGRAWSQGFKVTLVFAAGSTPAQSIGQMIKRNVEAVNPRFHVDLRALEWATYLEQSQQRKIPMLVGAWQADYPDPHNFIFPLLHSSGYFPTQQGYANPALDKLIEEAAGTLDEGRRAALYRKIQEIYEEDLPHVQIADTSRCRAQRSWVKGYVFNPVFPDAPYGSDYRAIAKINP